MDTFLDPTFWAGVGAGGSFVALAFFLFIVAVGAVDEHAEHEPDRQAPLYPQVAARPTPAANARQARSAGRRWPANDDVDGFAQQRGVQS